jgi:FMN phosphatase YigB (HAD superfamily)
MISFGIQIVKKKTVFSGSDGKGCIKAPPMKSLQPSLPSVPQVSHDRDWSIAQRYAPEVLCDALEPFLPVAVGYTIFTENKTSDSFGRDITLPEGCAMAIEYAVWWDWDIEHLYELEHLWVYLDDAGRVMKFEGSFHGDVHELEKTEGSLKCFSEPGKHAFANLEQLMAREPLTTASCTVNAGSGDVLINAMFESVLQPSPSQKRICKRFMKSQAFMPGYTFSLSVPLATLPLVPWETLKAWIPDRVKAWLIYMDHLPRIKAVLLDCGDTLVDEGTEVKDADGRVLSGDLIPGAGALLAELKAQGYSLALVADGFIESFANLFKQHQFEPYFDVKVISEQLGVEKPSARMFQEALNLLGLAAREPIVMVGNNLSRDILGANCMGLSSIWLDWAPRRAKIPANPQEVPDHTIKAPLELLSVLENIEIALLKQVIVSRSYHA